MLTTSWAPWAIAARVAPWVPWLLAPLLVVPLSPAGAPPSLPLPLAPSLLLQAPAPPLLLMELQD